MILFYEDWFKEENRGARPDYETKNTSFLRVAAIYKKMGVKNHSFLLALHDPTLKGVDPYNENLSDETKVKIAVECKRNPWYFFREVLRIPSTGTKNGISFIASRGNIGLIFLFLCHITLLLIMPRQTGKSMGTFGLFTYLIGIACINTTMFMLTKDNQLRLKSVENIKELLENLPSYLFLKSKKDTYNTESISIDRLGNRYITAVGQSSEAAANNIGRGQTLGIIHLDEGPFVPNIEIK